MLTFTVNEANINADYDEESKCYKGCLKERMNCANACKIKHKKDMGQVKYKCMHRCDKPFNEICIKPCPAKK